MNTHQAGCMTSAARLLGAVSHQVAVALRATAHTSIPPHVGMFAGSLLSHHSWTPPKVPH